MSEHKPNRLAQETSPYLLQHAHNPVDWYPWSENAFKKARTEDKPIFLSVGYSTCYWCHVMERQSFENEAIATEMNQLFINIKVDREERPDVDQIYMTAVQVMTRHGGWPMSVWLTPDLKPFYAGTYFPPTDAYGRPGFATVCRGIADAWKNRRKDVLNAAEDLTQALQQLAKPQPPTRAFTIDDAWMDRMIDRSTSDYDPQNGGFGTAPKFPRETLLRLLLIHQQTFPHEGRMRMIRHTLDALAAGGIRDHLGGGFHRYSTDAHWLVPHFEIMLYDNAMLAWIYAEAFAQTGVDQYQQVCRQILDFLLREMRSPQGVFYTAFDAEVDAKEGDSYLWTLDEVKDVLGETDAEIFARAYGLNAGPNFVDPHHGGGQPEKSVLYRAESSDSIAKSMRIDPNEIDQRLTEMREKLYQVRARRKQPGLDTKIIWSWNALAMGAFARAGRIFKEERYLHVALRLATYFLDRKTQPQKFLDDGAFLADAFLELADANGEIADRDYAAEIIAGLSEFRDPSGGAYFFTAATAKDLIVRQKVGSDSPLPTGAAVAARVMLQLGQLTLAESTLREFAGQLQSNSESMSAMLELAHRYLRQQPPLKISPASDSQNTSVQENANQILQTLAQWEGEKNLRVFIKIADGFHINSHDAANGLVPTLLFISGSDVDRIDYPPSTQSQMGDETIRVYTDQIDITVHFKNAPDKKAVRLELQYQPCNDQACLPPVRKTVDIAI
ncbi:MAG TPA: DUF255 domain-containing protein [Tepidisphaeraceae bacterium]|jgi:hypothetical protein